MADATSTSEYILMREGLKQLINKSGALLPDEDAELVIMEIDNRIHKATRKRPIELTTKHYKMMLEATIKDSKFPNWTVEDMINTGATVKSFVDNTYQTITEKDKLEKNKTDVRERYIAYKKGNVERGELTELIMDIIKDDWIIHTTRSDKAPEMWIYKDGIYIPEAEGHITEMCQLLLGQAHSSHIANEVIFKIKSSTFIDADQLFKEEHPKYIPVENGIIDTERDELLPFTPDLKFFNKLPVKYDPEKDCPNIKKHLKTVLKHEDDIKVMQELFGWLPYRDYTFEKGIMMNGTGRNGKGKTIELMKTFLGAKNCVNISLQELDTVGGFVLARLHKKLANLGADMGDKALISTSYFKMSTGRDQLTADRKFKEHVNFTNYAKHVFACNTIPKNVYDDTIAFWDRWILFDFPFTFKAKEELEAMHPKDRIKYKQADHKIIDKLTTSNELSGLLNWALEGLKRLHQQEGFSHSKNTHEVREAWLRRSDSFQAWAMDNLERDASCDLNKADLRHDYTKWCQDTGITKIETDKSIKSTLTQQYGASMVQIDKVRMWRGVRKKEKNNFQTQPTQPKQRNLTL